MVPSVYKSEYVLVNGEEIESGKKFKFPATNEALKDSYI
jgi:hypothetical protein